MPELFDTHAHYTDNRLRGRDELITQSFDGGVGYITCVGTSLDDSRECAEVASRYPHMYSSAGIHPHECEALTDIDGEMNELERLLKMPKVVALGEIGLDYHYDSDWADKQKKYFRAQLELAKMTDMPVIIHDRDAHGDVFDILREYRGVRGIIHSCSESAEAVREYVKMGWYISFSGVITFKNASKILESVMATPADRILIETDSPYLAPVPVRGTDNFSYNVRYTAQTAANVLGMDYDEFCAQSTENAKMIYGIED
ncbi:MAG: TatD family hydrolase [Clostridia bacterium]|nr:TatD family hydrolase [Clostridia bacterium]